MPYKFIVAQGCSTALESAPAVIKNALGRMTWAGRHHAQGAHFEPYNEVLALGYFEESKIGVSGPSPATLNVCRIQNQEVFDRTAMLLGEQLSPSLVYASNN